LKGYIGDKTIIDVEKQLIDKLFDNATKVLTEEDRKLPAVINIIPLIRRGIGIHHGGIDFVLFLILYYGFIIN